MCGAPASFALQGAAASAYDPPTQFAVQQATFKRPDIPYYGWLYPPSFLLVAAALARLPYLGALALWQSATVPLYLAATRAIFPRKETILLALAFPAVFVDLTHGQNGFFSAALLGTALLVLDKRPLIAGILIGVLAYKPQFGMLIPLVLAASGRWRAFGAAAATVAALAVASSAAFGIGVWRAFFDSMPYTRVVVLEQGGTGFYKFQSVFAAIRLWGGPVWLAYAAQGAGVVSVAASLVALCAAAPISGSRRPRSSQGRCWPRPIAWTTTSSSWRRRRPSFCRGRWSEDCGRTKHRNSPSSSPRRS